MSRQKLGQHFLADVSWRKRIADTLPACPDSVWLEIGAGHGEMTQLLAQRARRVIAIETDPALASVVRQRAVTEWPNVEVVESDILLTDLLALAHDRFRVYGNLPYYITSPILAHLFRFAAHIDSIHVVTQLEVAQRIAAHPGTRDYGYLSTLCRYYARPELLFRIPPGAFHPPPKVTSALLEMHLPGERASLDIHDDAAFLNFMQLCFAHKRKTLRNNLRDTYPHDAIAKALLSSALTGTSRAEELTLRQFAQLFAALPCSSGPVPIVF
ncbi:MAG TPA: 16S rRNA (adenine(1518)-N(6)/adenine(1519)-N(6))-dimethyltransferase RsmA [Candidatus Acidoferrales bacterium]|nr:16S rRNA (adenine(1518)-N(6)/adenine(1519)-N(6))-dimethyltransferase RsmA [Candidatus Acidoferrales bacterium]